MLTVQEAQKLIKKQATSFGWEEVPLEKAAGRVLYENVLAERDYPPFNRSAMDGFAVRAEDLKKYSALEIVGEVFAGDNPGVITEAGRCVKIMTGAALPKGANAVIRVEDSLIIESKAKFEIKETKEWANIAKRGEDARQGEIIVKKSSVCNPSVIAQLAANGQKHVKVFKTPTVAIISTGNEIKDVHESVTDYQIRNSNSSALAAFLSAYNIPAHKRFIVPDKKEDIEQALKLSLGADIIILTGGVSMGDADFVPDVLKDAGIENLFHKVQIKPGKPIWFGNYGTTVVFALPGNPFSCQVAFKVFIEPFLRACFGLPELKILKLPIREYKKKKTKFEEYFPCRIVTDNSINWAEPVLFNGSGDITKSSPSDGLAIHIAEVDDLYPGKIVDFLFWSTI